MQEHLEIRESVFAETRIVDSHIAAAYSETARAMLMNGIFSKARTLIYRSIELRKQMPKFSRLQLHSPLMYLAWIDWHEGSHQSAVDKLSEALRDREVEFGRDDHENMRLVVFFPIVVELSNAKTYDYLEGRGTSILHRTDPQKPRVFKR